MDLNLLNSRIDDLLGRYEQSSFSVFFHESKIGAFHSIERPGVVSPINSAFLCELKRKYDKYCPDLDIQNWKRSIFQPALRIGLKGLKNDTPEKTEVSAYQISQILRAAPHTTYKNKLKNWLFDYLDRWLLGTTSKKISIFLVHRLAQQIPEVYNSIKVRRAALLLLNEQITYFKTQSPVGFDAIELALSLSMVDSLRVPPQVIDSAVDILNTALENGGTWARTHPSLHIANKTISCSSFEAITTLFTSNAIKKPLHTLYTAIDAHLSWLNGQMKSGKPWIVSDILSREPLHETWFNCIVFDFLNTTKNLVAENQIAFLLSKYSAHKSDTRFSWASMSKVLDTKYVNLIRNKIINPAKSLQVDEKLPRSTIVLFGPPGTAKTTIAEVVSKEIGWKYVELGVAAFLRNGFDRVFSTADEIFADLAEMQEAVILLDEVESVFERRTKSKADVRQKFLTSALLPPLRKLRSKARTILFVATNHIRSFDAAILRPGRIDYIIPVAPPNNRQRIKLLIEDVGLDEFTAKAIAIKLKEVIPSGILSIERSLKRLKAPYSSEDILKDWETRKKSFTITTEDIKKFNLEKEDFERLD